MNWIFASYQYVITSPASSCALSAKGSGTYAYIIYLIIESVTLLNVSEIIIYRLYVQNTGHIELSSLRGISNGMILLSIIYHQQTTQLIDETLWIMHAFPIYVSWMIVSWKILIWILLNINHKIQKSTCYHFRFVAQLHSAHV